MRRVGLTEVILQIGEMNYITRLPGSLLLPRIVSEAPAENTSRVGGDVKRVSAVGLVHFARSALPLNRGARVVPPLPLVSGPQQLGGAHGR
jgi:hypothetical protein